MTTIDARIRSAPLTSVTASAARLTNTRLPDEAGRRTRRPKAEDWQAELWETYNTVGEFRFLANTLANRIGQAALYVGEIDPGSPTAEPVEAEDEAVQAILAAFGGNQAGRNQLFVRLGLNLLVPGEGWLLGLSEDDLNTALDSNRELWAGTSMPARMPRRGTAPAAEECSWRALSVTEISAPRNDGTIDITLEDQSKVSAYIDDVRLIRVWRAHPEKAWEADSPARAALPILREIIGLMMMTAAQIDSRLAGNGMLAVNEEVVRAMRIAAGLAPDDDTNPLVEALIEAYSVSMADRGSAAATVPIVATFPNGITEPFKHYSFATPLDAELAEKLDQAIRRFALSQDAPPEILLGGASMNHWGLWLTAEETVTVHVEPPLALMCDAITTGYLWPALIEGGMAPEEAERFVVWYTIDHMVTRPNSFEEARALYEAGAIDRDEYRRAGGYDLSSAPGEGDTAVPGKMNEQAAKLDATSRVLELVMTGKAQVLDADKAVAIVKDVLMGVDYVPEPVPAALAPGGEDDPVEGNEVPTGPTTDGPPEPGGPPAG